MCHLKASASIGAFVLVIPFAPIRFRGGSATTSARFGHGSSGIDVSSKEKHCSMGNVLNCCNLIAFRNLSLIEEDVLDWVRYLNGLCANKRVYAEYGE